MFSRMCPRRARALLKWCALCLIHTSYSAPNPLEVKQPCRVCARDLHTFMIRCFSSLSEEDEVSAYFYGNLSHSRTHLRRKSRMQSEREKRALSQTSGNFWLTACRLWIQALRGACLFFSLLQGRKREWWKECCVPVGGQHRHNPGSENDWPREQPCSTGRGQIECMAALEQ